MLSYLSLLPFSVLHSLNTEANKFYDRSNRIYDAALLARCYTQHVLRQVIDFKFNHVKHFIKIPFINKGRTLFTYPVHSEIHRYNQPYQSISRIVMYQSFVINIINLLGALYLISIKLCLILISKFVPLTPETVRILNMVVRLRSCYYGQSENYF